MIIKSESCISSVQESILMTLFVNKGCSQRGILEDSCSYGDL